MSIYRKFHRAPQSDVHHDADHVTISPKRDRDGFPTAHGRDWAIRRKAKPAEVLLPTTIRWMAGLPRDVQPLALGDAFPRIANMLAQLWPNAGAFRDYLSELLVDRRGGRKGFPVEVLTDLHRLRAYHSKLHPDHADLWDLPRLTR